MKFGNIAISKIETFYTGGGIYLTAADEEGTSCYFIISSDKDYAFCLSKYDRAEEQDYDEEYPCMNMLWSKSAEELDKDEAKLWKRMFRHMGENS